MDDQKRSNASLNGHSQSGTEALQEQKSSEQNSGGPQKNVGSAKASAVAEKRSASAKSGKETEKSPAYASTPRQKEAASSSAASSSKKKRRMPPRSVWTIIGCFALLVIAISGVVAYIVDNARNVTLYQIGKQQTVQQYIGGGGIVYPRQQFDLSYAYAERVVSVLVKAGDHVNANQPLIKLDPTQLNAQINQAASDVAAARAYLNSVSGNINPVTVAAAQQQLQVAENHYNSLVAQASSDTLRNGNLISPITGTVTAVNINPGEVFAANTVLITIMDQSTVTIRAKIPLSNLSQVKVGMSAIVTPSALPDVNVSGVVSSIIQQADPQTDTVEVWVEVKNAQQQLLPGMSAFARIQGQVSAFSVPRLAVLNPDHNSLVFIERNGKVYQQTVHVVSRSTDNVYVDQGLAAGDRIVLIPLDKMHSGQQIKVSTIER